MSLRSIIRKGRFYCEWSKHPEKDALFMELSRYVMRALSSHYTICVNAQSVWDDIAPQLVLPSPDSAKEGRAWDEACVKLLDFSAIPQPKPPYEYMWLETLLSVPDERYSSGQQQCGALVWRIEMTDAARRDFETKLAGEDETQKQAWERLKADHPATVVLADIWHAYNGSAAIAGNITYWLDSQGRFQYSFRQIVQSNDSEAILKFLFQLREAWVLQTFARMNCRNVELRPIPDGKSKPAGPNKLVPASVWHEIVINSVPKIRSVRENAGESSKREIREHWIRGHYADYRDGAGLFGNASLRAVFWIPEHRAGNPELGQVIPEYAIQ